jgi:hypothetical protein
MINLNQTPSNNGNAEKLRILVPVIIVVIVVFAGKKLLSSFTQSLSSPLEALNIKDTEEEKNEIKKAKKKVQDLPKGDKNPFSPRYYTATNKRPMLIPMATANLFAKRIKDAIGIVYDSPENIIGVFRNLNYKTQVSFLAKVFFDLYGIDLLEFLEDKLDTTTQKIALGKIIEIVNNLKS